MACFVEIQRWNLLSSSHPTYFRARWQHFALSSQMPVVLSISPLFAVKLHWELSTFSSFTLLSKSFIIVHAGTCVHLHPHTCHTHMVLKRHENWATLSALLLSIVTYKFYLQVYQTCLILSLIFSLF